MKSLVNMLVALLLLLLACLIGHVAIRTIQYPGLDHVGNLIMVIVEPHGMP